MPERVGEPNDRLTSAQQTPAPPAWRGPEGRCRTFERAPTETARAAPCDRYSSSGNPAAVPRRDSTATSSPDFTSSGTAAGMTATRVSPGSVSFGMPISHIGVFHVFFCGLYCLQPVADRLGDSRRDGFVGQRRVFGNITRFRRRQQVVDSGQVHDFNRSVLSCACAPARRVDRRDAGNTC